MDLMMAPVPTGHSYKPAAPEADSSQRMMAEARRLLVQHKITGADAMRIQSMLEQAENSMGSGKRVDARRFAQEALELAKESNSASTPGPAGKEENAEETPAVESAANPNSSEEGGEGEEGIPVAEEEKGRYADRSEDAGVSYQYEQPLSHIQAPLAVRQHELSHVWRDTSDAIIEGKRVMATTTIFHRIDYESGKPYVAGGKAHIIIFPNLLVPDERGKEIDVYA